MIRATIMMVLPSKKRPEALGIMRSMVERTRFMPGCVSSHVWQDTKDDRVIILEEWWNSEEDLERHLRSDEYGKVLMVMEMALQPPEVMFQTISSSTGMETIEKARSCS